MKYNLTVYRNKRSIGVWIVDSWQIGAKLAIAVRQKYPNMRVKLQRVCEVNETFQVKGLTGTT